MQWTFAVAAAAVALSSCAHWRARPDVTTIQMDFTRAGGFFTAPFPNEDLRLPGDRIDVSGFPGLGAVSFIDAALNQIALDARGFSTTAGIFFTATAELDPSSLPRTAAESVQADATVFLVDLERGQRVPIDVAIRDDGGRFGAPNLLSLLPYQGIPLRESTLYAAVVTTRVRDWRGKPLGVCEGMRALREGRVPKGLKGPALAEMRMAMTWAADAAALAVFRTDAPRRGMAEVRQAMLRATPLVNAPFKLRETYPDFCVFETTIDLPQYQDGAPPFSSGGGRWVFDAKTGAPVLQRFERARAVVTLPRSEMPAGGFPTVVYSRTGSGGDRSLVDKGTATADGRLTRGSGPALEFARAGFAAVMVDGPHGGLRNPTGADEQFLVFNLDNPSAIRDNVRQSAAELILVAHALDGFVVDARGCGGSKTARFDGERLALFGHSMGATIAPIAMAYEPRFKAAILSGSGGSFIANALYKQKPLPVRRLAELMFGYTWRLYSMSQGDPALSMIQWAMEPADPPLYGGLARGHVLMFQGIVDHYILPPMANATSLALGLDLAGPELDRQHAELLEFTPYSDVAKLVQRGVRPYPVEGNVEREDGSRATAVVVQGLDDGLQDGHEVVFQTPGAKYQYRCFLSTFAAGSPRIVAPQDSVDVCEGEARVER